MKRIILVIGVLTLLLVSGCKDAVDEWLEKTQIEDNPKEDSLETEECSGNATYCGSDYYSQYWKAICLDNKCIRVDCVDDLDCPSWLESTVGLGRDYSDCINYTCVDFEDDCEKIAKSDYNMVNPICMYKGDSRCWCKDKVVDEESYEIKKENSIQTIPEVYHYTDMIMFDIN